MFDTNIYNNKRRKKAHLNTFKWILLSPHYFNNINKTKYVCKCVKLYRWIDYYQCGYCFFSLQQATITPFA